MQLMRLFTIALTLFALCSTGSAQDNTSPTVFDGPFAGYGDASARRHLDLDTPRSALETYMLAASRGDFERAARVMDFSSIPQAQRAPRAVDLAEHLYQVLERRVWLDWDALPDRADGVLDDPRSDHPMAGEHRRSVRIATLQLGDVPASIRMNRVQPDGQDAIWVFSAQTVASIDPMYSALGPTSFEQAIPQALRREAVFSLEVWELITVPLLLLLAASIGGATYRLAGRVIPSSTPGWATILSGTRLPFSLLTATAVLWVTLSYVVTFSGPVTLFLDPLTMAMVLLALVFFLSAALDTVIEQAVREDVDDLSADEHEYLRNRYTNVSAARRLIILALLLAGAGFVLSQTNLFRNLGLGVLASAGVIGLAVGFAAREVLSNILASLQVAFSKSARIGDRVIYDGYLCTVEQIYFTYVQLLTWDDRRLVVPVNELVSTPFENLTLRESRMTRSVTLILDHRADPNALRDAFFSFVEDDDRIVEPDEAMLEVIEHDRQGIHARFRFVSPNPAAGWDAHNELRERLLQVCRQIESEHQRPMLPVETERRLDSDDAA